MVDRIDLLCSGMFSDELDKLGYCDQVIGGLVLNNGGGKCLGPVRTLKLETVKTGDERILAGLTFLETMKEREILCVEGSNEFAYFGELMTRLAVRQNLSGVLIGGLTRDLAFTRSSGLAIFSFGYSPKDIKGRGRVFGSDIDITVGGVVIRTGDWLFGDADGVVVIPKDAVGEVLRRVQGCVSNEEDIAKRIDRGEKVEQILFHYKEF